MVLEESCVHFGEAPSSISFSGSGFLATYQIGVAQCFVHNAPWLLRKAPFILGASAGSLVAAAVACEVNLITMQNEMLNFSKAMKAFTFGPFNPSVEILNWIKFVLNKYLPSDAHLLANGRLAVVATRLDDGKPTIITKYRSKDDVVRALLCSCFVPGYCGMLPPSLNGVHYMDGGFSQMQPVLELPSLTLTVSPFSGEADICPRDQPSMLDMVVTGVTLKGNLANGFRFWNALYPIKPEIVEQAYHNGYKDAFHFLLNNELVPNMKMMTIQELKSTLNCRTKMLTFQETTPEEEEEEDVDEMKTTVLFFLQGNQKTQTNTWTELQSTIGKLTVVDLPFTFETAKNILTGNVTMYGSMMGPSGFLTYLVLPMMLLFQTLLETKEIVESVSRGTPGLIFWTWCSLRQLAVFFFGILLSTFMKNVKNRLLPIMLKLQLLEEAQTGVPLKHTFPPSHKESSCPALSENITFASSRPIPPLRGL
ncbi:patatin-like phospholipase domain-containing protein 2 [Syngnathus typhle]|uniref:patatin-like phospholipase domain-containing protein 2 n=1 Tax=Syngnathus typhle TaxID=161592 RepID=UPI002A6AE092|nr:patatin-like phospholipase domain-containing protein 2 [Syngnathus typhle]